MPDGSEPRHRVRAPAAREPLLLEHPVSPPRSAPAVSSMVPDSLSYAVEGKTTPPMARPATRHWRAALAFVAVVLLPTIVSAVYLIGWAEDRYASRVAFSVRSSEPAMTSGMLGALAQIGGGTGADADIVRDFLQSQEAVERVGRTVDLEAIFSREPGDWVFSLSDDRAIEDVTDHWNDAIDVAVESASGIIDVEVRAFRPDDAHAISSALLDASADLVNRLSEEARRDAVGYTKVELHDAEQRLTTVRRRLRHFRDTEREVDPGANAAAALGLVAGLEQELAEARVALGLLGGLDRSSARVRQLTRRIESLTSRIDAERDRLGQGPGGGEDARPLSHLVGDYEDLLAERAFAEQSHAAALAAHQLAVAEARQHQRFLAVHVAPTAPERSDYPDRPLLIATVFALSLALWWAGVLIVWNVRDRG